MKRRVISLLLTLAMCFSLVVGISAADNGLLSVTGAVDATTLTVANNGMSDGSGTGTVYLKSPSTPEHELGTNYSTMCTFDYVISGGVLSTTVATVNVNNQLPATNPFHTALANGDKYRVVLGNGEFRDIIVGNVATYIVKFDSNGGTCTIADQTFTSGVKQKLTKNPDGCFTIPVPTTDTEYTVTVADKDDSAKKSEYKVTVKAPVAEEKDLSKAAVTVTPSSATKGEIAQTPTVQVKLGSKTLTEGTDYQVKWTDKDGNEVTDLTGAPAGTYTATVTPASGTDYTGSKTAAFTLHPANTYTVTYKDGVNGTVFADVVKSGLEKDTATPAFGADPTREGYDFDGWTPAVAAKVTANATYTAKWKIKTFTVSFSGSGSMAALSSAA